MRPIVVSELIHSPWDSSFGVLAQRLDRLAGIVKQGLEIIETKSYTSHDALCRVTWKHKDKNKIIMMKLVFYLSFELG